MKFFNCRQAEKYWDSFCLPLKFKVNLNPQYKALALCFSFKVKRFSNGEKAVQIY